MRSAARVLSHTTCDLQRADGHIQPSTRLASVAIPSYLITIAITIVTGFLPIS